MISSRYWSFKVSLCPIYVTINDTENIYFQFRFDKNVFATEIYLESYWKLSERGNRDARNEKSRNNEL